MPQVGLVGLTIDRCVTILRFQVRHVETGFLLQWSLIHQLLRGHAFPIFNIILHYSMCLRRCLLIEFGIHYLKFSIVAFG